MNKIKLYKRIIVIFTFVIFICGVGCTATHNNIKDNNMIIGKTELEQLSKSTEFWGEYTTNYASYDLDKKKLNKISKLLKNRKIHIIAVIGTWCGDTREQFPIFQKILDNLPNSNLSIEYIGVNHDKLAGKTDISGLNISLIPVFIFYDGAKELGRIVETPEGTMEGDILKIVNHK